MFLLLPYAKKVGLKLEVNGIERSIGAIDMLHDDKYIGLIDDWTEGDGIRTPWKSATLPKNNLPEYRKGLDCELVHVFGPYIRPIALEMMSQSMFGCDFYHLDEKAYGNNMESAMMEIIHCGAIPVFDSHFGTHCKLRGTDTSLIDIPNFAVWSHKHHGYEELVNQLDEISKSPKLIEKYRKVSLEVATEHADINFVMKDMVDVLSKTKKRTNYKFSGDVMSEFLDAKR